MRHAAETCQVLVALLESFRKIAIAERRQPLLPDAMASDSPPIDAPRDPAPRTGPDRRGHFAVAGRVVLASIGGYGVAALATALGAVTLPLSRAEAVSASTMASFAVMAGAVVFVFAAATLRRVTLGIAGTAAFLTACLWLAGGFSGAMPA